MFVGRREMPPSLTWQRSCHNLEIQTMFSQNNHPVATINFLAAGLQLNNCPTDLFASDDDIAAGTFAALCCSPLVKANDQYLVSIHTLALRQLALFAAGAQVCYNRSDFRDLESRARGCFTDANHADVSWLLQRAYDRAKLLGLIGPGSAEMSLDTNPKVAGMAVIEPEDGRGFSRVVDGLSTTLLSATRPTSRKLTDEEADWQLQFERLSPAVVAADEQAWLRKRLFTFAAVFAALKPTRCQNGVEAVVFLALYGAGVDVQLDKEQYKLLEMTARQFKDAIRGDKTGHNYLMAKCALKAAAERASLADIG